MLYLTEDSLAHLVDSAVSARSLRLGRAVHAQIVKALGSPLPAFLSNHLVNMYAKLARPDPARLVLSLAPTRSVVTWTALIAGSVRTGLFSAALADFAAMLRERVWPNDFTLPCAFKASASLGASLAGRQVHAVAVKVGETVNVFAGCGALDMYAKTGLWEDARKVFDEMPQRNNCAWNAYISNAVLAGRPGEAIAGFAGLVGSGLGPDPIALCAFLNACSDTSDLGLGRQCHALAVLSGLGSHLGVSNGLVDFYGKCRDVGSAERVFGRITDRNDVSWCSMMATLAQNHEDEKACAVFLWARREARIGPNGFMVSTALGACAGLAGLELGRSVHALAVRSCPAGNAFVGSALVDMYGKCGAVADAERAFAELPWKNSIVLNAMMSAYAHQGLARDALELLDEMADGPNYVTFVCLLTACSRAGAVEKGLEVFESMKLKHGIEPGPEHYACVVDLLGRAGLVDRAFDFVKNMPIRATISIWGALLGACKMYRNTEIGRIAAENLFKLDPKDSGNHVVLSNMLASSGRWEEATLVRREMKDVGVKKNAGYSWIAVKNTVHAFQAKDRSHERDTEIQAMMSKLRTQMEEAGYVPDTNFALFDVEEEEKASEVWSHSEKIALAFGLVAVPPGVPIRITKNLRICGDCHSAMKFASAIVGREIVIRDNNRFHLFKDGVCSCRDYW